MSIEVQEKKLLMQSLTTSMRLYDDIDVDNGRDKAERNILCLLRTVLST